MRYYFPHFSVSISLAPFLSYFQISKIYFNIEGNVQRVLNSNLFYFSHWDLSFTVQYFSKPQMKGLFPGYDNVIGSKVIVSISSHRKLFWSFSWGQKLSWWGEWGERRNSILLYLKGFNFIPLLHSAWKVPSNALHSSCYLLLPWHFFFYSSSLC